ncbi:basic salivary proline-rich protein 3-like [Anneissia japonica]|uniref:basic salivary proline-rich protein 3-like n=1 Tax=Anneissia japonica TaxID=1529436 RepID=UPI0014258D45|nr:basic salivary proline-rich protein 3-like [Anneissia japonica]
MEAPPPYAQGKHPPQQYAPPPQQGYAPPPQQGYAPPPQGYPMTQGYAPPPQPQQAFAAPSAAGGGVVVINTQQNSAPAPAVHTTIIQERRVDIGISLSRQKLDRTKIGPHMTFSDR